mmetsp:Transcript_26062/g.56904  ORF Transcript_26062/g.56904 Transcript_26062/m.56904 type:complete len:269 (+) Transcript_26062:184-990(+)|eukprot:CAMPEP_0202900704 /NCGR_PEP_ID=MMETSP1392-20130828/11991_1 /ASSEMBLY_ACC=CAM_ASM_000868 /TAXON_ID=225041 /ORGANISM="Chlamydomonas chlamydogama, Strain SAG 11-48b" /LENGTH=268 /DNA_ID=CAMNT_0049587145 /DNA_START=184 /DNA_END=990 /DNA_ORIENTATION=+
MSVAAASPFTRAKRIFDDNDFSESALERQHNFGKRARFHSSPSAGRCASFLGDCTGPAVSPLALSALLSLFPGMDEKVVSNILAECGNNIDAAIKRLGCLKLSSEEAAAEAAQEASGSTYEGRTGTPSTSQPSNTEPLATAEQWVEFLVQEMAAAKDLQDARSRAGSVLQRFEKFMSTKAEEKNSIVLSKLAELQKENHILKRAVQIQNTKLQEKPQQEQEIQQLKHMLAQYQEQLRTLEVNNYSLALHLQKATNNNHLAGQRNPDVF